MRLRRKLRGCWAAVTLVLLAGHGATLRAQPASGVPGRPSITGVVRDAAGESIADVEVRARVARIERLALSGDDGVFRLFDLPAGAVTLTVRRLGFAPGTLELPANRRNDVAVSLVLARVEPPRLDTVRVETVAPVVARLTGFERRRALGAGTAFITREQIWKRSAVNTTDVLAGIPALKILDSQGVLLPVSNRGRKPDLRNLNKPLVPCVMRVGVNGVAMPGQYSPNEIRPNDIHGIEVFAGPAALPLEFGTLRTDTWCGLVMIWTRSG